MRKALVQRCILLVGIILFFICSNAPSADLIIKTESYIPLEKCNISFSIFSNGTAKYRGRHCLQRSIRIRRRLSTAKIASVQKMINEVQFCELRDRYSADGNSEGFIVLDSETLGVTAYCGNATRSVSVYGIDSILERNPNTYEPIDRAAVQRFDRLHSFVLELLILK